MAKPFDRLLFGLIPLSGKNTVSDNAGLVSVALRGGVITDV